MTAPDHVDSGKTAKCAVRAVERVVRNSDLSTLQAAIES